MDFSITHFGQNYSSFLLKKSFRMWLNSEQCRPWTLIRLTDLGLHWLHGWIQLSPAGYGRTGVTGLPFGSKSLQNVWHWKARIRSINNSQTSTNGSPGRITLYWSIIRETWNHFTFTRTLQQFRTLQNFLLQHCWSRWGMVHIKSNKSCTCICMQYK
jgi:hypothetical protein